MHPIRVLLLEDDELASELIYEHLRECGFEVVPFFTATDGVAHLKNGHFDIMILDINLPDFDGFEVLKSLRKQISIPVIVTSAYGDTKSKLMAFKYGAVDYMVKPIDLEELEARIWVHLSKNTKIELEEENDTFLIKEGTIYFHTKRLALTTIEYEIMAKLIENKNKVVSRDELVSSLSSYSSHRSLDNHIKNIRKKLGENTKNHKYLKTEYGVGYILAT
jgi:DNA-binding response OmpR family regulator